MAGRYASLSRSLMSSARASTLRSPAAVPRFRPPPSSAHRRRTFFAPPRNFGELGCTQSFLPFTSIAAMPHLTARHQACCELSYGTFRPTCQSR